MDSTDKSSKKCKRSAEVTVASPKGTRTTIDNDQSASKKKKKKVKVSTIRKKRTEAQSPATATNKPSKKPDEKSVDTATAEDRSSKKPRKKTSTFAEGAKRIFQKNKTTKESAIKLPSPSKKPDLQPSSPKKPTHRFGATAKKEESGEQQKPGKLSGAATGATTKKAGSRETGSSESTVAESGADESVKDKKSVRRTKKNATKTEATSDGEDVTQRDTKKKKKTLSAEQGGGGGDGYDKQLAAFVKETIKIGVPKLVKDFHEARATAPKTMPKTAFEKNHDKNRYKDVICMDETRVVLKWPSDNSNDYIHANWVKIRGEKRYICTQGPTSKTVEDFWRLIFQEKCKGIVMLTEVMELGKKKCEQYWPKGVGETVTSGLCTIVNKKVIEVEKMLISTQLEITANGETLKCEHVLWTGWPDRGVPDNYLSTLRLIRKMAPFSPCVVHCSAGIGRTGTIVGLDLCQRTLQAGEKLDMHEICKELRKYRHGSVQTDVQFVFMHAVILKLAENRKAATKDQMKAFFDEYTAYVATRQ